MSTIFEKPVEYYEGVIEAGNISSSNTPCFPAQIQSTAAKIVNMLASRYPLTR